MLPFVIPSKPEKLLQERTDAVCVTCNLDWDNLPDSDLTELCQSALFALNTGQGIECINSQACLDAVFASIWLFKRLPGTFRTRLVNGLCRACSVLVDALPQLESSTEGVLLSNVAQELAFFCSWITEQCKATHAEEEQKERSSATGKKTSKGLKTKAAKGADADWDFCHSLEQLGRAGAALMSLNVDLVLNAAAKSARFMDKCREMALAILSVPECAKHASIKAGTFSILCSVASHTKQVESLASALMELAVREEHAPELVVEAAVCIDARCNSAGMVVALLHVFTAHEPEWYDQEAAKVAASVKQACEVMIKLAETQPKVVAPNLSLMLEYLACSTVSVRVCVIRMLKTVLIKVFAHKDAGSEREQAARSTSRFTCYEKLVERLRDKGALVRVEVLKTFSELLTCEAVAPPDLPHLLVAIFERLGDSVLVKKAALQALDTLLKYAGRAWGPLDPAVLKCTLDELEAKLEAVTGTAASQDGINVDLHTLNKEAAWDGGDALTAGQAAVDGMEIDGEDDTDCAEVEGQTCMPGTQTQTEMLLQPTQAAGLEDDPWGNNAVKLRHYVDTVRIAVRFASALQTQLPLVREALNTQSADVAKEAIALVYTLMQLRVPGTDGLLRSMWSCMFSREEAVRGTVVDAMYNLYLKDAEADPEQHAKQLAELMPQANLSEAASFEELMRALCADQAYADSAGQIAPEMPSVVRALLRLCDTSFQAAIGCVGNNTQDDPATIQHMQQLRSGLLVLAMAAPHMAKTVRPWLPQLLVWVKGCMVTLEDAWSVRQCCLIIKALAPTIHAEGQTAAGTLQDACTCMLRVLASPRLGDDWWYMAADAAMAAVYTLHPHPHDLMQPFLLGMIKNVLPLSATCQLQGPVSAAAFSRCLFLTAHCAMHQLALVDQLAQTTRTERVLSERLATERQEGAASKATRGVSKPAEDDISTQVGGSTALGQDAALDALKESVDAELLHEGGFLRSLAIMVSLLGQATQQPVLQAHATLRDCILLSMSKFMVVDRDFCDRHVDLLLNWLNYTGLHPAARASLVVSLADLSTCHPNSVEPFTARMNEPLQCLDAGVRKTTLTVLSHLILNGMRKVKGHVASMALGLIDADATIQDWAARFFATLATRGTSAKAGTNPIYNTLPDMLSSLATQTNLNLESAKQILKALLPFVKDSKQAEAFKEKLCQRFASLHEAEAATAADFAAAAASARQQQTQLAEQAQQASDVAPQQDQLPHPNGAAHASYSNAGSAAGPTQATPGDDDATSVQQAAPAVVDEGRIKAEPMDMANTGPLGIDDMDVDMPAADTSQGACVQGTRPSVSAAAPDGTSALPGRPREQSASEANAVADSSQATEPDGAHAGTQALPLDAIRREQKLLAQCLMEMPYTEKGARTIMGLLRCYKHALGDKDVFNFFWNMADHTRKKGDSKTDIKDVANRFKAEIEEVHRALRLGNADLDVEEEDDDGEAGNGQLSAGMAATQEDEHAHDGTADDAPSSMGSMAGGKSRRASSSSKSTAKSAATKATGKASKGGSKRGEAVKSSDDDDDSDGNDDVDDQDEVVGPCQTAGSRQRQQDAAGRSSGRATAKTSRPPTKPASNRRRKQVQSSSDDDDDASGNDIAADDDQGVKSDDDSIGQRMQGLKISSSSRSAVSSQRSAGGRKRQSAGSRARGALTTVEEDN